ncbi:MAG: hypothetical protein QNK61_08350, partial [Akkermansiaceae bacterium]
MSPSSFTLNQAQKKLCVSATLRETSPHQAPHKSAKISSICGPMPPQPQPFVHCALVRVWIVPAPAPTAG